MRSFFLVTFLLCTSFLICSNGASAKHGGGKKGDKKNEKRADAGHSQSCDTKLWKHVYNPDRLTVIDPCKEVTGFVDEIHKEEDGDQHMLLRLDDGQQYLLKKRNYEKKDGKLVIEIVCANPVKDKKAVGACVNYNTPLPMPKLGQHIRVTGSYVLDTHNGWTEIHPVSKIETMK